MLHTEYKIPACPACAGRAGRQNTRYGGFTLVEVLVAMTIFVGTLVIMSQIYVSAMRSERVAYALLQDDESVRYALDYMSKTIRMGRNFHLNGNTLSFNYYYVDPTGMDTNWKPIEFSFQDNSVYRTFLGKEISLLPPAVQIPDGHWHLISKTNERQAEIKVDFTVQSQQQQYKFHIRTAVTPRLLFDVNNPNP